jgi:hypothetical protein
MLSILLLNNVTVIKVRLPLNEDVIMLLTIAIVLGILWLLGFIGDIGGGLIHLLLVVALIVFIYNMIVGRRSV